MPDYGHHLMFAANIVPTNQNPEAVVRLTQLADQSGLDLVVFQDHPYQPAFLDTWTLLSYVAARTTKVRLSGDVHPIPMRPPAVLARSAASLDLLSNGRFELALGTGGFPDAMEAMGGPRRTPGEAVTALEEAIQIIRGIWDVDTRGGVRVDGEHYRVVGAKRGPRPAHDIGIWLGAVKPRMLRLTGRVADGWLPSLPGMEPHDLVTGNTTIDEAAIEAGRAPTDVRRLLNLSSILPINQLAELTLTYGFSCYTVMIQDPNQIQQIGHEVAPAVRELVAKERATSDDHEPER